MTLAVTRTRFCVDEPTETSLGITLRDQPRLPTGVCQPDAPMLVWPSSKVQLSSGVSITIGIRRAVRSW